MSFRSRRLDIHSRCPSFDGSVIVQRSIEVGQPIIYVSMNHRYDFPLFNTAVTYRKSYTGYLVSVFFISKFHHLNRSGPLAFGFPGGSQVKAARVANIGLHDRKFEAVICPRHLLILQT